MKNPNYERLQSMDRVWLDGPYVDVPTPYGMARLVASTVAQWMEKNQIPEIDADHLRAIANAQEEVIDSLDPVERFGNQ